MAEAGVMVQRRAFPPRPSWAVDSVVEEGYLVSVHSTNLVA
jgi:hypothetical protein